MGGVGSIIAPVPALSCFSPATLLLSVNHPLLSPDQTVSARSKFVSFGLRPSCSSCWCCLLGLLDLLLVPALLLQHWHCYRLTTSSNALESAPFELEQVPKTGHYHHSEGNSSWKSSEEAVEGKDLDYCWCIAVCQPQNHAFFSSWPQAQDPSPKKRNHSCLQLFVHPLRPSSSHHWSCCWQCWFHLPFSGPRPCSNRWNYCLASHKICCCLYIYAHSVWISLTLDSRCSYWEHLC